jgi:GntR family transcriptional repressor for pyruvate dehydrogenase complex
LGEAAIRTVRRTTVVDGVIGEIKRLLHDREMQAGAKLPGERELARKLGVSRPSVREALRTLEQMGVLDTRHGAGSQLAASGSNVLKTPLEFLLALDRPSIADLHETRVLLEVHLAGQAARRRTDNDLAALEAALRAMRIRLASPRDMTDPDLRFHQAVATAAHNRLLERVMNCLHESIRSMMDAAWPGNRDMKVSLRIHEDVHDAIRRRRPEAARKAMRRHMAAMTEELRQVKLIP